MKRILNILTLATLVSVPTRVSAQTAAVTQAVHLRDGPSKARPSIRVLKTGDDITLLETKAQHAYYHVRTSDGVDGWVWTQAVRLGGATAAAPTPRPAPTPPVSAVAVGPGTPGSASEAGCGDGLWAHVYNPSRLLVLNRCATVSGVIVDATANQSTHQPDGVRHEADGDTHGWLKVDPQFTNLLDAGNQSAEDGNLVFEIVCHFPVTQADAKPACSSFGDHTVIPPIGTHVVIRGSYVQDQNHARWMEIHPVSSITPQ